jgi:hypothetical protein
VDHQFGVFCDVLQLELFRVKHNLHLRKVDFLLFPYHFHMTPVIVINVVKVHLIAPLAQNPRVFFLLEHRRLLQLDTRMERVNFHGQSCGLTLEPSDVRKQFVAGDFLFGQVLPQLSNITGEKHRAIEFVFADETLLEGSLVFAGLGHSL